MAKKKSTAKKKSAPKRKPRRKSTPHRKKSTQAEMEKRIGQVMGWLLEGHLRGTIVQTGSKLWAVSIRQVDEYIHRASTRIGEAAVFRRDIALGKAILRLNNLYRLCLNADQFGTARAVNRDYIDLLGLAMPSKSEVEVHTVGDPDDDELVRMSDEALRRLEKDGHGRGNGKPVAKSVN